MAARGAEAGGVPLWGRWDMMAGMPRLAGSAARLVRTSFGDAQAPVIEPEMLPDEPQDGEA